MEEITKERIKEYVGKMKVFCNENKDVLERVNGLTWQKLKEDLEEAVQYQRGYYKNDKGEYCYVKGIEVTNDTGNLLRMGMNGEDRGVWVHYCYLEDRRVGYVDVPIATFLMKHDARFTNPDELMKPTTREDFEEQVKRTIQNIVADYPEAVDVQHYLDVIHGADALDEEYKDVASPVAYALVAMESKEV